MKTFFAYPTVKSQFVKSLLNLFYYLGDATPSANSYTLPQLIGAKIPNKKASAAYSMTSRSQNGGFAEDLARTPGPGRYNTLDPHMTKAKAPAYSILGRNNLPGG